jgi:hypothetical protein
MEYSKFAEIILRLKKHSENVDKAYKLKIDVIDFSDDLNRVIDILIREVYGEEGYDWFTWFCYESDFGEKDWSKAPCFKMVDGKMVKIYEEGEMRFGAHDEDGNPICYSVESTWEYLEKNYNKKRETPWESIEKNFEKIKKSKGNGEKNN